MILIKPLDILEDLGYKQLLQVSAQIKGVQAHYNMIKSKNKKHFIELFYRLCSHRFPNTSGKTPQGVSEVI